MRRDASSGTNFRHIPDGFSGWLAMLDKCYSCMMAAEGHHKRPQYLKYTDLLIDGKFREYGTITKNRLKSRSEKAVGEYSQNHRYGFLKAVDDTLERRRMLQNKRIIEDASRHYITAGWAQAIIVLLYIGLGYSRACFFIYCQPTLVFKDWQLLKALGSLNKDFGIEIS